MPVGLFSMKSPGWCGLCLIGFLSVAGGCAIGGWCAEPPPLELKPIIVSKSTAPLFNSYAVGALELPFVPFRSAVEVLSLTPLDLQSRSPHHAVQTDFSLRGSSFQGVSVLVDGRRVNDPQTAHHNSDIPFTKEDIGSIEVTPGVSPALAGPDAIGGAVNFILKKPRKKALVFETGFGQYETKSGLFSVSEKNDLIGIRFSAEHAESKGFYTDTDFRKTTASLASEVTLPYGIYDLSFGYQEKEFGAYDFYTPASGFLSKEWTKTCLLNAGLSMGDDITLIKPHFLWRRHYDTFMLDKTQVRSRYLNHHRTDMVTPGLYLQKKTQGFGTIGLGCEYGQERIVSTNLGKHNRTHKSLFLDDRKDLSERISLGASFRADEFGGFPRVYTGSGSLSYEFRQAHTLTVAVSRNMRIPSFTELYYNDPTTLGNADLLAEKSMNYQAGYAYNREGISLGMGIFFREEKDLIDWVKRTAGQAKWQVENIAAAQVLGMEGYSKIRINAFVTLDCNYTYNNKSLDGRGYLYKYGPNYLLHLFNTSVFFHLPFGVQSVNLSYKKKPGRDGWFLLNSRLSRSLSKHSQIFLEVTNLLNVEYQEIAGIPQPGRWVEAGMRFEW